MTMTHRSDEVLVDPKDQDLLSWYSWFVDGRGYLCTNARCHGTGKRKYIQFHRVIMPVKDGQEIDHINRNPLDNRKENLRICSRSDNCINRNYVDNAKGIYPTRSGTFLVQVQRGGKLHSKTVKTYDEAVDLRDRWRKEHT